MVVLVSDGLFITDLLALARTCILKAQMLRVASMHGRLLGETTPPLSHQLRLCLLLAPQVLGIQTLAPMSPTASQKSLASASSVATRATAALLEMGLLCILDSDQVFVLLKNASVGGTNWYIYDSARNTYNVMGFELYPNASNAEASRVALDFTSNGFKIRSTASGWDNNNSGNTIIFAAFAENPFKNALAR